MKIENQDEIAGIIAEIEENTNDTGRESVNDQPTNINDYLVVQFHHKTQKIVQALCIYTKTKTIAMLNSRIQVFGN